MVDFLSSSFFVCLPSRVSWQNDFQKAQQIYPPSDFACVYDNYHENIHFKKCYYNMLSSNIWFLYVLYIYMIFYLIFDISITYDSYIIKHMLHIQVLDDISRPPRWHGGTVAPDLTKLAPPRGDFPRSRQAAIQLHVQRQHLAMAVMGKKTTWWLYVG